jgi:hypothetical protein
MATESKRLRELHAELESCGYKPGTKRFQAEERRRKVQICKEARGTASCWDCSYFDYCELVKAHLRDMYKS